MYYLYILHSVSADKYYVGITDDYTRRLKEHNTTDRNTFTKKYRPWVIAAVFQCGESLSEALKIERFVKRQKSKKFIMQLIDKECFTGICSVLILVDSFFFFPGIPGKKKKEFVRQIY